MNPASCPFCNAIVPSPAPEFCPRCEERLPGGTVAAPSPVAAKSASPLWFRVGFPLSCVASLALLIVGLVVVNRGEPSPPVPATKSTASEFGPATVPPLGVVGLRYLPAHCQIVAAVQTAPLTTYAERLKTDPKQLLRDAGLPETVFVSLANAGVAYEMIDHLALGLSLPDDNAIPGTTVVVALKSAPADPSGLVRQVAKEKVLSFFTIALVNERFLILVSDANAVPREPKPNADHLAPAIRETIQNQISPAAVAWLATDTQSWHDRPAIKAAILAAKRPDLTVLIARGRALALSFSLEPEFNVGLAVKCDGEETAKQLQDFLGIKGAGKPWVIGGTDGWAAVDAAVPPKEIPALVTALLKTQP
jgi:hypothetical protein